MVKRGIVVVVLVNLDQVAGEGRPTALLTGASQSSLIRVGPSAVAVRPGTGSGMVAALVRPTIMAGRP